jgi:hypothetical protein
MHFQHDIRPAEGDETLARLAAHLKTAWINIVESEHGVAGVLRIG